jgi:hypothetical protein
MLVIYVSSCTAADGNTTVRWEICDIAKKR